MLILSFGGVPDDVAVWAAWIETSAEWLSTSGGERMLLALGLFVVLAANIAPYRENLPLLNRIDSVLPAAPDVEDTPLDIELMLAGLWWHWSGNYYRWTNDPILQVRCPDHHDVTLLMKYKRTMGHSLEKIDWDELVATKTLLDIGSRSYLYCVEGDHAVLPDDKLGILKELNLRANTAVVAKARQA